MYCTCGEKISKNRTDEFCSSRCREYHYRWPESTVCPCGRELSENHELLCEECAEIDRNAPISEKILSTGKGTERSSDVRKLGRTIVSKAGRDSCSYCGYSKRIECCYIRPIKDFPLLTKMGEIARIDNLVVLCSNHRLELRKGLITIDDIRNSPHYITQTNDN